MLDMLAKLRSYPSEEDTETLLRSIPDDMAEALETEPAVMLSAISRLHGLMSHWTTRLAVVAGRLMAAKHARDIGLEAIKLQVRQSMKHLENKTTEAQIREQAVASKLYADLCLEEVQAKTEHLRVQGLVDAIATKKDALKMLTYYAQHEIQAAGMAYSLDVSVSESTKSELKNSQQTFADMKNKALKIKLPR